MVSEERLVKSVCALLSLSAMIDYASLLIMYINSSAVAILGAALTGFQILWCSISPVVPGKHIYAENVVFRGAA